MEKTVVLIKTACEDPAEDVIPANRELIKFVERNKYGSILSALWARLMAAIFVFACFLSLNIAISLWLGEMFDHNYYGFFAVAVFYCVCSLTMYFILFNWIRDCINKIILKRYGAKMESMR